MSIDTERSDLDELERKLAATLNIGGRLKTTLRKNWLYSFDKVVDANCHEKVDPECDERKATCAALLPPECTAKQAVDRLAEDLKGFVEEVNLLKSAPEGLAEANAKTKKMQADLAEFNAMYRPESGTSLMADANTVAGNVARTAANTDLLQSSSSGYDFGNAAADFLKKVKTIQDFVLDVKESESYTHHDLAEITLPMAAYRQKPMTETITCKDALSGVQAFDSMIFTAFYENTPRFDISA
ncbi:MAG: hypothetical protein ABSF62_11960, partial [Bryobacteraceae bacterium]